MYICTLEVYFQKFVAGFLEGEEELYNISALYINISELEVREGYCIYWAAFETSPRFSNEIGKFLFYRLAGRSRRKNRKNRKKSGIANAFSRQVDRQARWLGKAGHEGMARQGGRPKNQAWRVRQGRRSGKARSGHR